MSYKYHVKCTTCDEVQPALQIDDDSFECIVCKTVYVENGNADVFSSYDATLAADIGAQVKNSKIGWEREYER